MNRVYNNEAIIMACIVHLLRRRNMDMPISYIMVTLLIDNQLGTIIRKSQNFEELSDLISNQGLISRKLASFGPYFINAMVILKQSKVIDLSVFSLNPLNHNFMLAIYRFISVHSICYKFLWKIGYYTYPIKHEHL